jgi:hypothetical protein
MSIQLIQQYYAKVDQIIRYGGSRNELSLMTCYKDLWSMDVLIDFIADMVKTIIKKVLEIDEKPTVCPLCGKSDHKAGMCQGGVDTMP